MKLSDFIVEYLINKKITDVFGYPGGMVTHLMDSFRKRDDLINSHLLYHEQALGFAACAYVQSSRKQTLVYATSGPGATNLITSICNAFFDSIPLVFITGQVNRNESSIGFGIRQRGFQETRIVEMVKPVTKASFYVDNPSKIKFFLDKAYYIANEGRKGPVLLDIPMDVFRCEINPIELDSYVPDYEINYDVFSFDKLLNYKRPVLIIGAGVKYSVEKDFFNRIVSSIKIPVVTSMISYDSIDRECDYYYGFIGAYGNRVSNFIVSKSDLIISIGSRLDVRQVGGIRKNFASNAQILRIDIDRNELNYQIRNNEVDFCMDSKDALSSLEVLSKNDYSSWVDVCNLIKEKLGDVDNKKSTPQLYLEIISNRLVGNEIITTDVGQNQVWIAQYLKVKYNNIVLFSGGHGAMGYSLPAAIGAAYAYPNRRIISFNGDGGIQMNIQELQTIARDRLPITVVVFNNYSLGMIRHFQEMYFNKEYQGTTIDSGYTAPNFVEVANGYGIRGLSIKSVNDLSNIKFDDEPLLVEICLDEETYVFPKLEFGKPNQDQEPLIDRKLYNELMEL